MTDMQEAPFTCKYCGQPSWIDPSDQSPPPDYCQDIDHGTGEAGKGDERDKALLWQALSALEEASDALYEGHPVRMNTQKAIAALRERLGEGAKP